MRLDPAARRRLRLLLGLLLLGQGLLVLARVVDHEAPLWAGALLALAGGAVVAWPGRAPGGPAATGRALQAAPAPAPAPPVRPASRLRKAGVAALGASAACGVVGYNLLKGSAFAVPELVLLFYGLALLAAAPRLDAVVGGARKVSVGTLVAYSFPLVLAPLGLWALNAGLEHYADTTPMRWYLRHTLVAPMAAALQVGGLATSVAGETVRLSTPQGALFLTVGVVCAGLYAGVLFMGVFALFAWEARTPPKRLAAYLALGLAGLHLANVARLVMLGAVGAAWGGNALQDAHQHLGWVLFLAWTVAFWALVLRRFEGPAPLAA